MGESPTKRSRRTDESKSTVAGACHSRLSAQMTHEMKLYYYVYAIRCFDGTFYVGVTNDVDRRFWQHQHESDPKAYTHNRGPLILEHASEFTSIVEAIAFEKKFKGWSHRKKRAFIEANYEAMRHYSRGPDRNRPQRRACASVIPSVGSEATGVEGPTTATHRGDSSTSLRYARNDRTGYNPPMNAPRVYAEMPRPDPGGLPIQPPQPAPGEPGLPENPIIDPPSPTQPT